MSNEQFWADDPMGLLSDLNPFPNTNMSLNEKFNALTRLVILITAVMFYMEFNYTLQFFLIAILMILLLQRVAANKQKDNFGIPPTYVEGSCPMTTVPPLHAEEWQSPPPAYDQYSLIPEETPEEQLKRYPYPVYGQYITQSSILPYQEDMTTNRPLKDAQPFIVDEFTRNQLQYRADMIRPFVNKLNRQYRHGCYDQISPYSSW